jgi:glycosyltransferase involved in cell wall biosynthesis
VLSVIIATQDSERVLVPTLATLVSGAAAGLIREVIVADAGSRDSTAEIADIAGCELKVSDVPLAQRLRDAAADARGTWLLFLKPGTVLDTSWVDETSRFIEQVERQGQVDSRTAVFRMAPSMGIDRSAVVEALALLRAAVSTPRPEQGVIIFKRFYDRLGGHRGAAADPERDLIARLGRRRIVRLRTAASFQAPRAPA